MICDACEVHLSDDEVVDCADTDELEWFLCRGHLQDWSEVPDGFAWSNEAGRGVWVEVAGDIPTTWYQLTLPVRDGYVVTPSGEVVHVSPAVRYVSLAMLAPGASADEIRYGSGTGRPAAIAWVVSRRSRSGPGPSGSTSEGHPGRSTKVGLCGGRSHETIRPMSNRSHPTPQEVPVTKLLPAAVVAGARVRSTLVPTLEGVVTRVLDREGARGGLVEVRWDHQKRVSRSAGFQLGDELELV